MREGSWFLAETEEEGFAQEPGLGIRTWIPVIHVWRLTEGFWKEFEEPIFPGYVLVSTGMDSEDVERILGVRMITNPDGACLAMTPGMERWIRKAETQSFFFHPDTFVKGERVRVRQDARSAFADLEGMFLGLVIWGGFHAGVVIFSLFGEMETLGAIPFDHLTHVGGSSGAKGRGKGFPRGMRPSLELTLSGFNRLQKAFLRGVRMRKGWSRRSIQ